MPTYTANCIYGYFGKQVPVFVNKRLSAMPYAQAGAIVHEYKDKQWISLISYESLIFSYCPEENLICFDLSTACPDYSRTTTKHVNAFCKEYIPAMTYQAIKRLYYDSKAETAATYAKYI